MTKNEIMKLVKMFLKVCCAAGALWLTACSEPAAIVPASHDADASAHAHDHADGAHWHFVDGRGVQLSEHGRHVMGLAVVDVDFAEAADDFLSIPRSAVLETVRGDFVYVRNGDYFFRTPVRVASDSREHVEIADGLFEGDVVAVSGVDMLWLTELQSINGGAACADAH